MNCAVIRLLPEMWGRSGDPLVRTGTALATWGWCSLWTKTHIRLT